VPSAATIRQREKAYASASSAESRRLLHKQDAEGDAAAERLARRAARMSTAAGVADVAGRVAAAPITAATGGQGGTVLLIGGVLFLGYLFLTRRLQRVLEVIRDPVAGGELPPATGSRGAGSAASAPRPPRGSVGGRIRQAPEPQAPDEWIRDGTVVPYPDGGYGEPKRPPRRGEWQPRIRGIQL